eukprot:9473543-Pyramimonas_sp.AAC.1
MQGHGSRQLERGLEVTQMFRRAHRVLRKSEQASDVGAGQADETEHLARPWGPQAFTAVRE